MIKNKHITKLSVFAFLVIFVFLGCHARKNRAPKLIKDSLVFIYPSEAREKQLEGTVILKILVNEQGVIEESEITTSSGYDILDETALKVAETARFKPAKIQGQKRSVWITWPLVFEITSLIFNPEEWIVKAKDYLYDINSNDITKRKIARQALYYHYKDFSRYMVKHRKLYLNEASLRVVLPNIRKSWEIYENSWPLTFILFQDYVMRFPESIFHKEAEAYLVEYIKNEMFQFKVRVKERSLNLRDGNRFYYKLLAFLQKNYPDSITKDMLEDSLEKG